MKNKVVHFEIPANDLEKAQEFYGKIFDWKFKKWNDTYTTVITAGEGKGGMAKDVGAINGGLQKRGPRAKTPTVVVHTDSIDEVLQNVQTAGGSVPVPKEKIGGMGFYAQFEDPEGNRIGLFQT